MTEPVNQGGVEDLVLDDFLPARERKIGRYDRGFVSGSCRYHVEQQFRSFPVEADIALFVAYDQIILAEARFERLKGPVRPRLAYQRSLEIYLRKSTMLPVVPFSNRMVGDFCFTIYSIPKQHERPSGRGLLRGCKVPSPEMPQAQRSGISSSQRHGG